MASAIDGFIDAALFVRPESMPLRAYIKDVRILRVDDKAADLARIFQSNMIPRRATVSGPVNAVTGRKVLANVRLAGSGVNNLRIGRCYSQCANRRHRVAVKDGCPDDSGICRFPDSAIHRAEIKGRRIARHPGHCHRGPPRKGPIKRHLSPFTSSGGIVCAEAAMVGNSRVSNNRARVEIRRAKDGPNLCKCRTPFLIPQIVELLCPSLRLSDDP